MGRSVLLNPVHLRVIVRALSVVRHRKATGSAEVLSLGVLPEFRGRDSARRTGRHVAQELFDAAKTYFRDNAIEEFYVIVDADNREALSFYRGAGCHFTDWLDGRMIRAICSVSY